MTDAMHSVGPRVLTEHVTLPVLPVDIIVEIACCDHEVFREIKHSCKLLYQKLSGINKLRLFTNRHVIDERSATVISYRLKPKAYNGQQVITDSPHRWQSQVLRYEFMKWVKALHVYVDDKFYMGKQYHTATRIIEVYWAVSFPDTVARPYIGDNDFDSDIERMIKDW